MLPALVGSDVQLAQEIWTELDKDVDHTIGSLMDFWDNVEEPAMLSSVDALWRRSKTIKVHLQSARSCPKKFWEPWAKGRLVYTPEHGLEVHPALLSHSGYRVEVEKGYGVVKPELLLPVLNEIRLRICIQFTDAYGIDWPFKWRAPANGYEFEQVKITPMATELGPHLLPLCHRRPGTSARRRGSSVRAWH